MRNLYLLRPGIAFLNHGSYGACPRPVFEAYQQWQRELEEQPLEFLALRSTGLLKEARTHLANYLNTKPENVVYISNATTGVNILARCLKLQPGDEILGTDHEYGAIDRTWRFICGKIGASYLNQPIPVPVTTPEEFIETFWKGVTPRTKIISLSHITSATAMVFPVEEICHRAREAGIMTIIDGAHAPGQIPLNLEELGADFYTGNLHKWLSAPKGAAFLYARPEVQALVEPLVISWGYEETPPGPNTFVDWLEWQGTRDISAFLAVPAAIEFQKRHNWPQLQRECTALLTEACQQVAAVTKLPSLYPSGGDWQWYVQMATLALPPCDRLVLKERLWNEFQVEIPTISWNNREFIRISIQVYNTIEDVERLILALRTLLPEVTK